MSGRVRAIGGIAVAGAIAIAAYFVAAGSGEAPQANSPDVEATKEALPPPWAQPPRAKAPRPDEREALPVNAAVRRMSENDDLAAVITAVVNGDVETLIQLAAKDYAYCQQGRGGPPPECYGSRETRIGGISQDCGTRCLRSAETMTGWLSAVLENQPVVLNLATRDGRYPEGDGGRYYLAFQAARPASNPDLGGANGLAVIVTPGNPEPIEIFVFGTSRPDASWLSWIQISGDPNSEESEGGARYHLLLAPATVKDWPGMWGQLGD